LHQQGRIVKPKINQFLLPDAAVAGWHCFLRWWHKYFTFDGEGVRFWCFVGGQRNCFGECTWTVGVVAYINRFGFARHDWLLWVGWNRATARSFSGFDDKWLITGIGEREFADFVASFFDFTVVHGGRLESHHWASRILCVDCERAKEKESEEGKCLFH
jgi:hypothetical protein